MSTFMKSGLEKPSCSFGQTDITKLIVAFCNFVNMPQQWEVGKKVLKSVEAFWYCNGLSMCTSFLAVYTANTLSLKPSTPCILAVIHFFLFHLNAHLLPFTSYMFQCLLHHLQGHHCVSFSKTISYLQCCYIGCAIKCDVYPIS